MVTLGGAGLTGRGSAMLTTTPAAAGAGVLRSCAWAGCVCLREGGRYCRIHWNPAHRAALRARAELQVELDDLRDRIDAIEGQAGLLLCLGVEDDGDDSRA